MDLAWVETWRSPTTRAELALAPGERLLGGGTWLFSEPQPDVRGLVDLTTLGWEPLLLLPDGGLSIAATCTIARVGEAAELGSAAALARFCAEALLMSFKVQGSATVAGNLCLALPAGAMISLFTALGAELVIWTPDGGERRTPVEGFVHGVGATGLRPGEVVRSVEIAPAALADRYAFGRVSLTTYGRSGALVTGRSTADGIRVVLTAATPAPVVLPLSSSPDAAEIDAAMAGVSEWYDDVHGAPDWRAAQSRRLCHEVVADLLEQR